METATNTKAHISNVDTTIEICMKVEDCGISAVRDITPYRTLKRTPKGTLEPEPSPTTHFVQPRSNVFRPGLVCRSLEFRV